MNRRVVITGMGAVTPLGLNSQELAESLKAGRDGISAIDRFDTSEFPVKKAGQVRGFSAKNLGVSSLDPFIQYAVSASSEAIEQSHIDFESLDPYRVGLSISSSKGGLHTFDRLSHRLQKNPSARLGLHFLTNMAPNFAAQWMARKWKIKGPSKCYIAACATGTVAIAEGYRMVRDGEIDVCLAGASDASIVPFLLGGYRKMKVMAKNMMSPFAKNREGFFVGEGAGVVLLETLENAQARQAKIFAEIKSYQYGTDCMHALHFSENENILSRIALASVEKADLKVQDIDYVNLHGTATPSGDIYETNQMKEIFGKAVNKIPMSSTKSMTGHMLGASGAVEIVACALAIDQGFLPPTINFDEKDMDCDLDYVANQSRQAKVNHTMSVSMGFGGHAASLILGKVS
jgi:3-oxoacyl-[acyl-carrier-protein] synthase II